MNNELELLNPNAALEQGTEKAEELEKQNAALSRMLSFITQLGQNSRKFFAKKFGEGYLPGITPVWVDKLEELVNAFLSAARQVKSLPVPQALPGYGKAENEAKAAEAKQARQVEMMRRIGQGENITNEELIQTYQVPKDNRDAYDAYDRSNDAPGVADAVPGAFDLNRDDVPGARDEDETFYVATDDGMREWDPDTDNVDRVFTSKGEAVKVIHADDDSDSYDSYDEETEEDESDDDEYVLVDEDGNEIEADADQIQELIESGLVEMPDEEEN